MPTFAGPTVEEAQPDSGPLLERYAIARGVTVVLRSGTWTTERFPSLDGLVEGTDYFLGGHTYSITSGMAATLTAAGFGSYIT